MKYFIDVTQIFETQTHTKMYTPDVLISFEWKKNFGVSDCVHMAAEVMVKHFFFKFWY
jgi:hypothetical protein